MKPTEELMQEHRLIEKVLDAAEREAEYVRQTGKIHADKLWKMLEFFKGFADACHHSKEEKHLFKRMEERGMSPEGGPLFVMLQEHDMGRRYLKEAGKALEKAEGSRDAAASLADSLLAYASLLKAHIQKEDNILYQMANRILTAEDQKELEEAFRRVEEEEMGLGAHERFHRLADEVTGGEQAA